MDKFPSKSSKSFSTNRTIILVEGRGGGNSLPTENNLLFSRVSLLNLSRAHVRSRKKPSVSGDGGWLRKYGLKGRVGGWFTGSSRRGPATVLQLKQAGTAGGRVMPVRDLICNAI